MKPLERLRIPMLALLAVAGIASVAAAKAATAEASGSASELRDLPCGEVNSAASRRYVSGKQIPDRAAPDASGRELVGRAVEDRQLGLRRVGRPLHWLPAVYGWVSFGQGSGASPPRGSVVISTSYGPTPSAATAVNRLRNWAAEERGHVPTDDAHQARRFLRLPVRRPDRRRTPHLPTVHQARWRGGRRPGRH